ncbi:hypothetical protein OPQ81_009872 [Rhizoctonia solani]|nr:hypothetical protein OPQ81_009872 [Rhizoctonia solani]
MIVAGMNALARRSCAWSPVRGLATTAKINGSGNNKRNRRFKQLKQGDKTQSQTETKPAPVKTKPTSKPQPRPTLPPTAPLDAPNAIKKRPHVPLPSPNPPLSAYALSPSKLRALIDLYHSSTNYITPETLSDAIDKTFAPLRFSPNANTRYQSYRDLVAERDELDAEPDRVVPSANELGGLGFGTADSLSGELTAGGWSTSKSERARMVKAALWGVDPLAKIGSRKRSKFVCMRTIYCPLAKEHVYKSCLLLYKIASHPDLPPWIELEDIATGTGSESDAKP